MRRAYEKTVTYSMLSTASSTTRTYVHVPLGTSSRWNAALTVPTVRATSRTYVAKTDVTRQPAKNPPPSRISR